MAPLHLQPLKSLGRANVKAEEYEDEIHDSKQHVEDGRRLLGTRLRARLTARHRG